MKKLLFILFLLAFMVFPAMAGEQLTLTTPQVCNGYVVDGLYFSWSASTIRIHLMCVETGQILPFTYDGQTARNLITALNTANLSTISLQKRILEYLVSDGKISGTVTGTPD